MMNYREFTTKVQIEVGRKLGSSYEVALNHVTKINTVQCALTIRERTDNIAQNIYLEDFYKEYQNGRAFVSIVDNLYRLYLSTSNNGMLKNLPPLTDLHTIRDRIAYKIINTDRNLELLKDIPHKQFFNLSIVLYCVLDYTDDGIASFLIRNCHLDIWETDFNFLLNLAFENTQKIFPLDIKGIQEAMFSIYSNDNSINNHIELLDEDMFYVVTNRNKLNGFSCILYPNLLERFSQRFGSFYILPSSLHEALLVPVRNGIPGDLLDMVKTVNATEVPPEDFLADSVYFYNSETNQIEM